MERDVRFLSLNKREDWLQGAAYNLDITEQGVTMMQTRRYVHWRGQEAPDPESVILDFALFGNGSLYVLDDRAQIWSCNMDNAHVELLLGAGHGLFGRGAVIGAAEGMLVVADSDGEYPISAYSSSNAQALWRLGEFEGEALVPAALASSGSVVFALCAAGPPAGSENRADADSLYVLRLNKSGAASRVAELELSGPPLEPASLLNGRFSLTAGVDPDSELYVLDSESGRVWKLSAGQDEWSVYPRGRYRGIAADSGGRVFIGDDRSLEQDGEDDRFIVQYEGDGRPAGKVTAYRGSVRKLLADRQDRLYVLDGEENLIRVLEPSPRTRAFNSEGVLKGILYTNSLDSAESETVWHRMSLDVHYPEETQLRVSYFASDRKGMLVGGAYTDLDDYLSDPDILPEDKERGMSGRWSAPVINPRDALFMGAKGRYLWMRLEWLGSERESPLVRKLRAYFPRTSYLSYLPAVYQEHEPSRDFLERYLSLYGTFMEELDGTIASMSRYFDPDCAEGPYLQWLSTWLGLSAGEGWEDEKLRSLVKQAPELYQQRGTRQGIEKMIEIYTGEKPYIIEYFQYKEMKDSSELKKLLGRLYGDNPYCFCILVKPETVETERQRTLIAKVLDGQKPAYTQAKLVVLQPWIYMDMHTYLGVNTYLSEPSLLQLDHKSAMPHQTVIIDVDLDNRMDVHTRLELDAGLE